MRDTIIVDAFKVIDLVRTKLIARVSTQTSWGKNQLELEIERAINDAMLEVVEFSIEMDDMPTPA